MILTDCYVFKRVEGTKSRYRLDCVQSTGEYEPLEGMRNKDGLLFLYFAEAATHIKAKRERMADIAATNVKGKSVTSLYNPNVELQLWYGDMKDTTDALLFVGDGALFKNGAFVDGSTLYVYVARGQAKSRLGLFNLLADGELERETETLKKRMHDEVC